MADNLPFISIIIPARLDEPNVRAMEAVCRLDYPADKCEVILARGKQPSAQRNRAVERAQGELIYFLDDDSMPAPGNLRRAVEYFRDSSIQMIGGPSLCPQNAPALEQAFALTMGTRLAFGPSRARYSIVGQPRPCSEKELILCNMLARRETFLRFGGFNEKLYPNEENALMDQIQKGGGKLYYTPDITIERHPRSTFKAFCKMLMNYGRGRAEQFRLTPTPGSILNFIPPAFCIYLVLLPFLSGLLTWLWWPLIPYIAGALIEATITSFKGNHPIETPRVASFIFLTHVLYGIGFFRGCFTQLTPPKSEVKESIKIEIRHLNDA